MNDEQLLEDWTDLEPTMAERARIRARVFVRLDARDTPLAAEWLGLFRVSPVAAFGLLATSAASLVAATPVLWIARALF